MYNILEISLRSLYSLLQGSRKNSEIKTHHQYRSHRLVFLPLFACISWIMFTEKFYFLSMLYIGWWKMEWIGHFHLGCSIRSIDSSQTKCFDYGLPQRSLKKHLAYCPQSTLIMCLAKGHSDDILCMRLCVDACVYAFEFVSHWSMRLEIRWT